MKLVALPTTDAIVPFNGNRLNLDVWSVIFEQLILANGFRKVDLRKSRVSKAWAKILSNRLVCRNAAAAAFPMLFNRLTLPQTEAWNSSSAPGALCNLSLEEFRFFKQYGKMIDIRNANLYERLMIKSLIDESEILKSLSLKLYNSRVIDVATAEMILAFIQKHKNAKCLLIGMKLPIINVSIDLADFELHHSNESSCKFPIRRVGPERLPNWRQENTTCSLDSVTETPDLVEEIIFERPDPGQTELQFRTNLPFPPMRRLTLTENCYWTFKKSAVRKHWNFTQLQHLTVHFKEDAIQFYEKAEAFKKLLSLTMVIHENAQKGWPSFIRIFEHCAIAPDLKKLVLLTNWAGSYSFIDMLPIDPKLETLVLLNGWDALRTRDGLKPFRLVTISEKYPGLKELGIRVYFSRTKPEWTHDFLDLITTARFRNLQSLHLHFGVYHSLGYLLELFPESTKGMSFVDKAYDGAMFLFEQLFARRAGPPFSQITISVHDYKDQGARFWNSNSMTFEKFDQAMGKGYRQWVADQDCSKGGWVLRDGGDARMTQRSDPIVTTAPESHDKVS